jgi:hypothetical protein
MEIIGTGILDVRISLQEDSDRPLLAQRLLRGGDRFRPEMVIGATTDGNSTVLRTGTMISASLGIGTDSVCAPGETEAGCSLFGDMATSRRFDRSQPNRIHALRSG